MKCEYKKESGVATGVAIFISILALITSGYIGYKAHQHNKLSVLPHLDVGYVYTWDKNKENLVSVTLTVDNPGAGPAVIRQVSIYWTEDGNTRQLVDWDDLSNTLEVSQDTTVNTFNLKNGHALKAGRDKLNLYEILNDPKSSNRLKKAIKNKVLDIKICYESLYFTQKLSSLQNTLPVYVQCFIDK